MIKYALGLILLVTIGILYSKNQEKYDEGDDKRKYKLVQQFLLKNEPGFKSKPIMWIYNENETNKKCETFNGCGGKEVSKPYIESCIETIVKYCGDDFNICLIDENSFNKLLPNWTIQVDKMSNPIKKHICMLGLTKILHHYGGVLMPNTVIMTKPFMGVYRSSLISKNMFACEMVRRVNAAHTSDFFPNAKIMGCVRDSPEMKELSEYIEKLISRDSTSEMDFLGQINRWIYANNKEGKVYVLNGRIMGTMDKYSKAILLEDLMGTTFIEFSDDMVGIYLPQEELNKRTKYNWLKNISQRELYQSDIIFAKHLLVAISQ
jgi:hypothetical protein